MYALLDNIRSAYNVGAMFRTADGAGCQHLYLCGITPRPSHPGIAKTALGAQASVPWTGRPDGLLLARTLRSSGYQLWGLEADRDGHSIFQLDPFPDESAIVLVVGNERAGLDPEMLAACNRTVSIPMKGVKKSLNAAVAFGIAIYQLAQLRSGANRRAGPAN